VVRITSRSVGWPSLVRSLIILLFLLSPFFILIFHFQLGFNLDYDEFLWAIKNSLVQSLGSAVLSVFFGLVVALGLLRFSGLWRRFFEVLLLLPNFIPTLFVLVFCLQWIEPFPMGSLGVILVHGFINVGVVAVLWSHQIESQFASQTALAFLEGASRWRLLRSLKGPIFRMATGWGLFVFVICFSSFTIPLVVGGGRGTTLEVLIYEKIRISADLGSAMAISALQGILVFALTLLVARKTSPRILSGGRNQKVFLLPSKGVQILIIPFVLWGSGYFIFQMLSGWQQVLAIPGLTSALFEKASFTLLMGVGVSSFVAAIFLVQISILSNERIHRDVAGLITVSPALVGFAFSLALPQFQAVGLILALACLYYPSVFRLGLYESLKSLTLQQQVARLLGASDSKILFTVTLPQVVTSMAMVCSVIGLWAMGDFAVSKIIFAQTFSLGMLAETLMSSYRIDAAFAICGLILILGLILASFFHGMAYVYHQKFK
jgi:thiamine transport system permease protein